MPYIDENQFADFMKGKRVALVGPGAASSSILQGDMLDSYDIIARIKTFYVPDAHRKFYGSRTDICYMSCDLPIGFDENGEIEFTFGLDDILPGDTIEIKDGERKPILHPLNIQIRNETFVSALGIVVCPYPRSEWFFDRFEKHFDIISEFKNTRIIPDEPYMSVRKITNRPNTGFCALLDLVSLPVSEIYVTGIDFYRSLYRKNYVNSHWDATSIDEITKSSDGPDTHDPDAQFKYFKYKMYEVDNRIKVDPVLKKFLSDKKYESYKTALGLTDE